MSLLSLADFKPGPDSMDPLQRAATITPFVATSSTTYPVSLLSTIATSTFNYGEVRVKSWRYDPEATSASPQTGGYEYRSPGYMKCQAVMHVSPSSVLTGTAGRVRFRVQRLGMPLPYDPGSSGHEVIDQVDLDLPNISGATYTSEVIELFPGDKLSLEPI